jgi:predicted transcriptional regulator
LEELVVQGAPRRKEAFICAGEPYSGRGAKMKKRVTEEMKKEILDLIKNGQYNRTDLVFELGIPVRDFDRALKSLRDEGHVILCVGGFANKASWYYQYGKLPVAEIRRGR